MNEKLISQVDELTVDEPCVDLVEEYFMADKEDAGEHILYYWVSADAPLVESVKELPAAESLLLDVGVKLG